MRATLFKAVLFDLDDTLVDRKSAYDYAYRCFYDQQPAVNTSCSWEEARAFFWSLSPNNATDARRAIFEIMRRWPEVKSDPDTHRRFYFDAIVDGMKPLPGVTELAAELNSSGIPWGVVTNGDHYQYRKVERVGMQETIPFVLASELFGAAKPAPEIYHEAVRMLRLPFSGLSDKQRGYADILFVGDNAYTDIKGAHSVGMRTAWVRMGREYPKDAPAPDHTIDNIGELRALLGL